MPLRISAFLTRLSVISGVWARPKDKHYRCDQLKERAAKIREKCAWHWDWCQWIPCYEALDQRLRDPEFTPYQSG